MAHQRFRLFDTSVSHPQGEGVAKMCMAVRAGSRVFLRGQTGLSLAGDFVGVGDAAAQADQAMRNARVLLEEAGARLEHVSKITSYVTDRAWWEPVEAAISRALGEAAPTRAGLIVEGLAMPEMLVAIDIDAVVPE